MSSTARRLHHTTVVSLKIERRHKLQVATSAPPIHIHDQIRGGQRVCAPQGAGIHIQGQDAGRTGRRLRSLEEQKLACRSYPCRPTRRIKSRDPIIFAFSLLLLQQQDLQRFQETGVHPEVERTRAENAAAATIQALPEPSTMRQYCFIDLAAGGKPLGAWDKL